GRMEEPSEEWEIEDENGSSSFEEEKIEKSGVSWILDRSLSLGKKVAVTVILISSAPLVLPPLVVISAIGVAFSVSFGFVYASYACTEKLMSKLLPETAPSITWDNKKSLTLQEEQEEEEGGNASLDKRDFDVVALEEEEGFGNSFLVKGGVVAMEEGEREKEEEQEEEEVENVSLVKGGVVAMEEEEREQVEEIQNESLVKGDIVAMEEEEKEQEHDVKEEIEVRIELVEDESKENGNGDATVIEAIKDDQEKVLSGDDILEEQGYKENEFLEKMGDIEIEERDKERDKEPQLECKGEKPIGVEEDRKFEGENMESLVKAGVVAMDEEEREQVEVQNKSLVKGNVVAMEEKEQEHDMKEEIEVRIELVEDKSKENGNDDAKVREAIKDDQEKVISRDDILEEQGYEEDELLKRMDDIEIEDLDKEREKEPQLECKGEKPIAVVEDGKFEGENAETIEFVGDVGSASGDEKNCTHCLEVKTIDYVEDEKNVGIRKREDWSVDKNDDKNVAIREEQEEASKNAELDTDVPQMNGSEGREEASILKCNEVARTASEDKEDRKGQNTKSLEDNGDEGARKDAKNFVHGSTVQPHVFVNDDAKNIGSRKKDDLPEDKNVKLDKVVMPTEVREKVKEGQTISKGKSSAAETEGKLDKDVPEKNESEKVKGGQTISKGKSTGVETEGKLDKDVPVKKVREKLKEGQTISEGKSSAVETEGTEKKMNLKAWKDSGNVKGTAAWKDGRHAPSSGKVEKAYGETKNSREQNDLNVVQDTKGKYEETGEETNVKLIKEHNGEELNRVPNDIKQDGEMEGTLLEKGDADHSKIGSVSRKSTDKENDLINSKHDTLQGENAGSVAYSDPGCEKNEENIISQEVSSNAKAEGESQNSGLFTLTDRNKAKVTISPDESQGSVDDVALPQVPELEHDAETKSKGNRNVSETDGALISNAGLLTEEKVWTQIDSVKAIIGYRGRRSASIYEEVKALYLFTGVEPSSSFDESSDVSEVYGNLQCLMSVIGIK
ncbi:Hypothetical predicted protein, partial [Olea europaea subsp. europaea]